MQIEYKDSSVTLGFCGLALDLVDTLGHHLESVESSLHLPNCQLFKSP